MIPDYSNDIDGLQPQIDQIMISDYSNNTAILQPTID
jgi:hypothetical protein